MKRCGFRFASVILGVGAPAMIALAVSFTWVGNGADDHWDTTANWQSAGCASCYPDDANDTATIDVHNADVDLVNEEISDLTIADSVTFGDADGNNPTLCVTGLTITGDTGGTEVEIKQQAAIETD